MIMSNTIPIGLLIICSVVGLICLAIPKTRSFLENNSGGIGVVFAVVAGAYVLYEYQIAEKNKRLDRTRSYIERVESGAVHASRQWLDLHWIKNRKLIDQINKANFGESADRNTSKKLTNQYENDFDETEPNNSSNIKHVMKLFYFYSDLARCVELGLCDSKTACNIFAEDIGKFYVLHASFITKWRQVSFEQNFVVIKGFMNKTCKVQ